MSQLDAKILIKRSETAGVTPSIPASNNHLDGSWNATDIYSGEFMTNSIDKKAFFRASSSIVELATIPRIQKGDTVYAVASGTNTYTASLTPSLLAYDAGVRISVLFSNANTAVATLNVNSLGAKSIKKNGSAALTVGDIQAGAVYTLVYDGTNFQIDNSGYTGSSLSSGTEWEATPFSSADWTPNGGGTLTTVSGNIVHNRYKIIGKTLIWSISVSGQTVAGAVSDFYLQIPGGVTSKNDFADIIGYYDGPSGPEQFLLVVDASGAEILIKRSNLSNLVVGSNTYSFQLTLEVN